MADAKKEEPTKPTPEEKLAAAEAEVDALVKKGLKALDDFSSIRSRLTVSSPRLPSQH